MRKIVLVVMIVFLVLGITVSAFGQGSITVNPEIPDIEVIDEDIYGNKAVSVKELELTPEDIEKIKEGNYTAALAMHYTGTDYMRANIEGLKDTFKKMGVEVIATTDAQFSAEQQISQVETLLAQSPDVIVAVPVEAGATSRVFQQAANMGVKLVFMDGLAANMKPGEDYISAGTGDNAGLGTQAAHLLAEKLNEQGKVGVVFHDADFHVTQQRSDAFEKTIAEEYPDMKVIARGGIQNANDGEQVASAMLTRYPNLDGMFVVWDVPAEGAAAAAKSMGREDLIITTTDLGKPAALEIANERNIQALAAQLPYDQGIAEAILAGYGLLGKEDIPPYVTAPALPVTKDNLLESWKLVYREEAPEEIKEALNK